MNTDNEMQPNKFSNSTKLQGAKSGLTLSPTRSSDHFIRYGRFVAEVLWNEGTIIMPDVNIEIPCGSFKAHKLVLACHSEFFKKWLKTSFETKICDMKNVDHNFITSKNFFQVLKFLYTGSITLKKENVSELAKIAEKLEIEKLTSVCELAKEIMTHQVNINTKKTNKDSNEAKGELSVETNLYKYDISKNDNDMSAIIPEVLFEGDILSLDKLNMLSVVNMNRILEQDILNCKEIDKFKLIMKWAESDKKRLEYLPQLLRYITFERMDSDEIMNCFIKMKPMENLRFLVSKFMRQGSSSKKSSLNDGKGNYSDTVFEQFDEHSKEKAALSKGFVNDELRERPVKIYKGVFDESKGEFVTNTSNKKGSGENSEVENNSSGTMSKEWIPSEKSVKAVNNSPNISSSESNQDTHQPQKDLSCPKLGNLQSSSENIASSISIPSVPSQAEVPSESEDTNISVNNSLSPNTDSSSSHLIKKDVSLEDKIMDGDNSVPQNLIGDNSVTQKLGSDSQVVQNLGGDNSVSLGPIVTAQPDEKNFLPNFENNKNVALIISESQERVTNYKIYDNAKNFYGNETKYREISNENFRSPPVLVNQTPMKGADSETLIGIPVYLRNSHLARDYQMIMKFETNEMKKDGGFTEKLNQPGTKPFFEDGKLILELTNDNQILQKEHKMIHTPPINPHAHHHPDHNCAHHSTFVNNSCRDNNALNYNHCVPKPHSNNNNVAMSSSQNMNVTGGRIPMIYNMTSMPNSIYNNNSFAPMMVSANRQIFDPQKYTGSVLNNLPLNTSVLNNHPLNTFTLNNQSLNTSVLSNQPLNTSVFNNQRLITSVLNNQPLKYF